MSKIHLAFVVFVMTTSLDNTCSAQQQKGRRPPTSMQLRPPGLDLPHNATSIRENIVNTFSCENRLYGYYADVDNECQIFHVCLPQLRNTVRFSFICPAETVFNQATFVCTRTKSSIPCDESELYYYLNEMFGKDDENTDYPGNELNTTPRPNRPQQNFPAVTQRPTISSTFRPNHHTISFNRRIIKPSYNRKNIDNDYLQQFE